MTLAKAKTGLRDRLLYPPPSRCDLWRSATRRTRKWRENLFLLFSVLVLCECSEVLEECSRHHMIPRESPAIASPAIRPIYYVHVPKTGSSIATAIVGYACPGIPFEGDLAVQEPGTFMDDFREEILSGACEGGLSRFMTGHLPLEPHVRERSPQNVVMMMRDPYERVVSGFLHNLHDCHHMQFLAGITELSPLWDPYSLVLKGIAAYRYTSVEHLPTFSGTFDPTVANYLGDMLLDYADCVQGCATRMMLGYGCARSREDPPSEQEIKLALETVPSIGFIGLTSQWLETTCLWSVMFPGNYSGLDLQFNTRPRQASSSLFHALVDLLKGRGWTDTADTALYMRSVQLFQQRMAIYFEDIRASNMPSLIRAARVEVAVYIQYPDVTDLTVSCVVAENELIDDVVESLCSEYKIAVRGCKEVRDHLHAARGYEPLLPESWPVLSPPASCSSLLAWLGRTLQMNSYLQIGGCSESVGDRVSSFMAVSLCVDPEVASVYQTTSNVLGEVGGLLDRHNSWDLVLLYQPTDSKKLLLDLNRVLGILNPTGIAVFCNCNPRTHFMTAADMCGDVWLAVLSLRGRMDLDIAVGDFDYGCAVIRKRRNSAPMDAHNLARANSNFFGGGLNTEDADWQVFDANRIQALHLLPQKELYDWVLNPYQ